MFYKTSLDSADIPLFDFPSTVPLEIEYLAMKSLFDDHSHESDKSIDSNNRVVISFLIAISDGKTKKNIVPKRPTTRQQSKTEFDNALKASKEKKKKKRRLVNNRLVNEEDVPPADVVEVDDEEHVKDTPLVRKNSKKSVAIKGMKPLPEKEIVSDVTDEAETEEGVEKEKVEKKKPLRKR